MSEDERTIFVGGISERVSEEILYELFLQAGPLEKVSIPKDKDGRNRKFAFVTCKHEASVPYTLSLLNGIMLYERPLQLKARNAGKDADSVRSPGMSPPVLPYGGQSPRYNQATGHGGQQFHRSNTWHGSLPNEDMNRNSAQGNYRQHGGSPSPDASRRQPERSSHRGQEINQYSPQHGQGWFNHGGSMFPPSNQLQGSNDIRRQRLLQQQQISIDAHRHYGHRHQNYGGSQQYQGQRYGRR